MKLNKVAIGGMLSVLLALPALSSAADESQQSGSNQDSMQSGSTGQSSDQSQPESSQQQGSQPQASSGQQSSQSQQASNQGQAAVMSVQARLKQEGYYKDKVDGIWGNKSTKALKKYQKDKDIQASGTLDQQTADKLGLSQGEFSAFEQAVKGGGQSSDQQSGHQPTPHSTSEQRDFSDSPKD